MTDSEAGLMLNFQTLFESIPGLYIVYSLDFVIVGGSDAYFQATKTKREEVVGRHLFEVFPDNPDDPNANGVQNLRASLESVLKHRKPHTMAVQKDDIRRPKSEGGGFEERYWSPINSPVFDENGVMTHIIHRVEDVTEFVRVQQQRNEQRQLNQVLESRTEQMEIEIYLRAQELQEVNEQLQAANEALSELDRAKTLFFSNVSHEFRTPLTLMLGPLADALSDTKVPLPAVHRDRLELVQCNGLRLLKLVNTLLDFSRIEAGRMQASYEPTDLATLTAELASVFRSMIEQAGMQLVVDCPPLPEAIYIERELWEKIVFNLLSNAFKFTFAGSITVRLRWVDTQVELTVEDTGIGIPPEELPHLFKRFHRVPGARGRTIKGSGIGLSLVQELSIPNSQFSPSARILLADDNADMRGYVQQLLSHQYEVETVADGVAALAAIRQQKPDLVLTDVMMPRLDGFGLLRELRADASTQEIPIILLSARAGEEARIEGLEAGADDYLTKPFSARELLARVEANLKLAQLRRDAMQQEQALRLEAETAKQTVETILSSLRDGFLTLNRDWRYTYVNDRQLEILKLPREAVMGKNVWDVFPDLVGTESYHQLHRAMNEHIAVQFEFYYPMLDCWIEHRVYPTADGIAILVADVSVRKRAQQTLRQSEERLRRAIEIETVGVIFFKTDGSITQTNDAFLRMSGYSREDTEQGLVRWDEMTPPEWMPHSLRAVEEFETIGRTTPYEKEYIRKDGSRWWALFAATRLNETEGVEFVTDITDRKQSEAALQQVSAELERQLRKFDAIASSVPDFIYTFDLSGRLTYINQPLLDLWQKTSAQALGKNFFDLDYPTDLATRLQRQIQEVIETRQPLKDETPYTSASGTGAYEYIFVPLFNMNGAVEAVAGVTRDITEHKQAELALRESEERFRNMADNAPFMVWVTDSTGYCTYLSQSWYDFTGQTEELGLGFGWLNATHPDDRQYAEPTFLEANERQAVFRIEYRLRRKDGEYIWAIDAANPWFGVDGQYKGYIGSVIDISDRKQAEEAVLERSRLSALSADIGTILIQNDTLPDTLKQCTEALVRHLDAAFARIWTLNREKNVLELQASAGMYTHLDGSHSQVPVGQFKIGLIAQERRPHLTNNVIGDPRVHDQEWAAREGIVAFAGYPLIVENQVVGVMALFSRHGLSEIALQAIASVANAVSLGIQRKHIAVEREQLLEQEQAAREESETANRIKDEFLAVLSHELRSPLNPILGWSKLLQQRKLDAAKTKIALATIERNAQLQVQLIDDLLDISRILRGKLSLMILPVDLGIVIAAALETVRLAAEAKSIQILTTSTERNSEGTAVGMVNGDAGRLQQVVWNLLSNAIKFTPEGRQISVDLAQVGRQAQIQVTDTGKGISGEFLPYVFEYFRQEDSATTRKFGGLGLGLAIVRQIVEMHGGTVAVDSPGEGQGATFTVRIPLAARSIELPSPERSSSSTRDLSGIHILVVEDDTDSREFVTFVLEQTNAIVTTVASGIDALQAIARLIPDVIVSDIGMPDMDGYMLMRQIRTWSPEQGGRIPAVALTAYAAEFDQQQALAAGFQQHVAKPVEPDALVKAITTLIESQK